MFKVILGRIERVTCKHHCPPRLNNPQSSVGTAFYSDQPERWQNNLLEEKGLLLNGSMLILVISRVAPDTELAGYPANLFFRISGIRPDIRLNC